MNSRWALLTLIPLLFISLFFFERRVLQKQPWESKNLSRLESLRGYPPVPSHRTLASQQSQGQRKKPPCAWERFTREEVRKEISTHLKENRLDKPYTPRNSQERWRGILLAGKPKGHVEYFLKNGPLLSKRIDVSHCSTAPCVFNTVYGEEEDDLRGYAAFLFFLKTGYFISATEEHSFKRDYIAEDYPLSAFYFQEDEIELFWKWMRQSPPSFFHLMDTSLYRLPKGLTFKNNYAAITFYTTKHSGNKKTERSRILLSDLGFNERTLSHEFVHVYDYKFKHSKSPEFKKLSGWAIREYTNEENRFVRQWIITSGEEEELDGFVRLYAQTNPKEDFAESVAYYIHSPHRLKECCPRKFNYIKEHIFQGRSYTHEGTRTFFKGKVLNHIQSHWESWFLSCQRNKKGEGQKDPSPLFHETVKSEFFNNGISSSELSCFESKMGQGLAQQIAQLKYNDFQACDFFTEKNIVWQNWLSQTLNSKDIYLPWIEKLKINQDKRDRAASRAKFKDQILERLDFSELVIQCSPQENDPARCFYKAISDYSQTVMKDKALLDEETRKRALEELRVMIPYEEAYRQSALRVKQVLGIPPEEMKTTAHTLVSSCSVQNHFSTQNNPHEPYENSRFLLKPWFLNCLNAHLGEKLQKILQQQIDSFNLDLEPVFTHFSVQVYRADFISLVDEEVEERAAQDKEKINQEKNQIIKAAWEDFKKNNYWNLLGESVEDPLGECRKKARQFVLQRQRDDKYIVEFSASLANEFCASLWENENLFKEGLQFRILTDIFLEEWRKKTKKCSTKYCQTLEIIPAAHKTFKIYREQGGVIKLTQIKTLMRDLVAWAKAKGAELEE